jgi:hypothetical protein
MAAAGAANAHDFITLLLPGYETSIGEARRAALGGWPAPANSRSRARVPEERAILNPGRGHVGARRRVRAPGAARPREVLMRGAHVECVIAHPATRRSSRRDRDPVLEGGPHRRKRAATKRLLHRARRSLCNRLLWRSSSRKSPWWGDEPCSLRPDPAARAPGQGMIKVTHGESAAGSGSERPALGSAVLIFATAALAASILGLLRPSSGGKLDHSTSKAEDPGDLRSGPEVRRVRRPSRPGTGNGRRDASGGAAVRAQIALDEKTARQDPERSRTAWTSRALRDEYRRERGRPVHLRDRCEGPDDHLHGTRPCRPALGSR